MSPHQRFGRRGFLLGGSAGLVLPKLEFFAKSSTAFAQSLEKPNFVAVFLANGIVPDSWHSTGTETQWQLGADLGALAPHQADISVLSNIDNEAGRRSEEISTPTAHWAFAATSFLTGSHYDYSVNIKTELRLAEADASIDQRIAALGDRPLGSLVMGLQDLDDAPRGDDRGSVYYLTRMSWANRGAQVERHVTSASAYRAIFGVDPVTGAADPTATRPEAFPSILDRLLGHRDRLRARLGQDDRQRLDAYFDSLRTIEQSIAREETLQALECDAPAGEFDTQPGNARINARALNMSRLAAAALSCGVTRSISYMIANEHNYGPSDLMIGKTYGGDIMQHHNASHYAFEGSLQSARDFVQWQAARFAEVLEAMKVASVLDQSMVLFGSGMSDGQYHSHRKLPLILAGRGGGLRPGRLISEAGDLSDLLLTLAQKAGVQTDRQGLSTRTLSSL